MLSVLIATFNSALWVRKTLSSVFANRFPKDQYEVIVVDDGSTDDTVDIVRNFPARLFACKHQGHGPSRNLGIRKARGEIICFTDSDTVVPVDWLKKISSCFSENAEVSAIGGSLIPAFKGHKSKIQQLTGEIYFEAQNFPTRPIRVKSFKWHALLASANSAYRREALDSVGGFPEFKAIKTNDMYVMWRLLKNGNYIMFLPDLKVKHLGFPWTLTGVFRQQFIWGKHRSMTTNAYNNMHNARLEKDIKQWLTAPYGLVRSLLKLPANPNSKGVLTSFQEASYLFGRLYGRGVKFRLTESK